MNLTRCPLFTVYNSGKFEQDLIADRIITVKIWGNIYVVIYRDILGHTLADKLNIFLEDKKKLMKFSNTDFHGFFLIFKKYV